MMNRVSQFKIMWALLLVAGTIALGGCGSSNSTATTPGNTNIFYATSVAFRNATTPMGWGYNGFGQLGDGTNTSRTAPAPLPRPGSFKGVVFGGFHAVAFGTYTAWTAGGNGFGQLGRPLETNVTQDAVFKDCFARYTTALRPKPRRIISVAAGGTHSLLADESGKVWAWGGGGSGQLGNNATANLTDPVLVQDAEGFGDLASIVALAAGGSHSLARNSSGAIYAWGYNAYGQLGIGSTANKSMAQKLPVFGNLTTVSAISAGGSYSLAIDTKNRLYGWGYNGRGQIGKDPLTTTVLTPFKNFSGVQAVAAGLAHVVALRTDGSVWTWGFNGYGQLGDNTKTDRYTAKPVTFPAFAPGELITDIVAFGNHSFAKTNLGKWYAWGDNGQGQLGFSTGSLTYALLPTLVPGL